MGGCGSTRWNLHTKALTVEDCWPLSVFSLQEGLDYGPGWHGGVYWTDRGEPSGSLAYTTERFGDDGLAVRLRYHIGEDEYDYLVPVTTTPVYFGGHRWWFFCPNRNCGRRVYRLYRPPGGRYFLCRDCYGLTYRSCQESHRYDRLFAGIGAQMGISGAEVARLLQHRYG